MFRLLFLTVLLNCGFANVGLKTLNPKTKEKVYVDLRDLVSNEHGFWFQPPGSSFSFGNTSLQWDSNGSYLDSQGVRWICPFKDCRAINDDISISICYYCKRDRNSQADYD